MSRSAVPVVLVAGYLGSGKTTLLNHLLRRNHGIRIGVVVNDFGAVDIDSMLVAGQVDSMITLGNGCLCCAVDTEDLDEMFGALTATSAAVDAIVVEASGVAEPRTLIRMVVASTDSRIRYGGMVMVVDALHVLESTARHQHLAQHLGLADLVVVNKADAVGPGRIDEVLTLVRDAAPAAPTVVTSHGAVDVSLLLDPPKRPDDEPRQLALDDLLREQDDPHDHLHASYETFSVETSDCLDPRAFFEFLENPPPGLYRSKGFVRFGRGAARFVVQTVGVHIDVETASSRGDTALVFIGSGLDVAAARSRIEAMIRTESATDAESLVVHRFLRTGDR
ncbi:CobW family GTP-binding protein [Rhodococcus sp. NBC_00297]|uniref:CobW family GTP-binding protein n=1 Tax=Rhodococcus sp. NBC_00297 TaxID=2976005 RepID=UPI002E28DD8E|nr:CobW family GTP-binding protein [Rhodococcus sp. NBC_00297]